MIWGILSACRPLEPPGLVVVITPGWASPLGKSEEKARQNQAMLERLLARAPWLREGPGWAPPGAAEGEGTRRQLFEPEPQPEPQT